MNWPGVFRSRVRIARHRLFGHGRGHGRRSPSTRPLLAAMLGLVLAAIVTVALFALFLALHDAGARAREASAALALLLTTTLIGMLAFDLHEVVSTLVLDSDLELLRRAPVPRAAIFALKLADAFPRTSALLVILAVPALLAFALVFPVTWWCWALVPPALVALWAVALGSGVAAAVLLLRAVPAKTAREALGLISTLAIFAVWLATSFVLPRVALESGNPRALLQALNARAPAGYAMSPGTLVAGMMAEANEGAAGEALRALGFTLLAGAAALLAASAVAGRNLDAVQARLLGAGTSGARHGAAAVRFAERPSMLRATLRRDLKLFARDWTVLGDLLIASVLWTLLPLVASPLADIDRTLLARAMLLGLTVALGFEIGTRAIPFERRGIAWTRLAPVVAWRWVAHRGLSTLTLALPIVAIATWAVTAALGLEPHEVAGTVALVAPALVVALAVGLGMGALHGNFEWTHPRAMLTLSGRALAVLLLLLQALGWLGAALLLERFQVRAGLALPALGALVLVPALLALTARHLGRREW